MYIGKTYHKMMIRSRKIQTNYIGEMVHGIHEGKQLNPGSDWLGRESIPIYLVGWCYSSMLQHITAVQKSTQLQFGLMPK